jgi:hypothetical protein
MINLGRIAAIVAVAGVGTFVFLWRTDTDRISSRVATNDPYLVAEILPDSIEISRATDGAAERSTHYLKYRARTLVKHVSCAQITIRRTLQRRGDVRPVVDMIETALEVVRKSPDVQSTVIQFALGDAWPLEPGTYAFALEFRCFNFDAGVGAMVQTMGAAATEPTCFEMPVAPQLPIALPSVPCLPMPVPGPR